MKMQLDHLFARKAGGCGKPKNKGFIQNIACFLVLQDPQNRRAGRRSRSAGTKTIQRPAGIGSRQTHHGDPCPPRSRGQGDDRSLAGKGVRHEALSLTVTMAVAVDATPEARIAHGAAIRATQRRLGEMVHGTRDMRRRMLFLLTLRLAQDVGWLARQVSESSGHREVEARAVAMDASDGLRAVATQLDGAGGDSRAALASLSRHMGAAWQADAVLVLQSDLHKLVQLTAASARGAT